MFPRRRTQVRRRLHRKQGRMYLYLPIQQHLYTEELGNYVSFGVAAFMVQPEGLKRLAMVSDVTPDEAAASLLACRCTTHQLEPCQLMDVVEDFLAGSCK